MAAEETAAPKAEEKKAEEPKATEAKAPEKEEKSVELSKKGQEILQSLEKMTVMELADLVKALEEKFGVSAAVPVGAVAAGGAAPAGGGEAAEEKTSFDVVLAEVGANKIQVIKEIRGLTELGLKEAKDLVEAAPKPVKTGVSKEDAATMKEKLEKVGAKVELK